MVVAFLRWLFGWTEFEVCDRSPERFLNLASKSGINMWNFKSGKELFGAGVRNRDMKYLYQIAKKTMCEIHITRHHGLPFILKKYRSRCGLLIGMILWGILLKYFSGFIWNIQIIVPPSINEYEIRQELKEYGFFEGAKIGTFDPDSIENEISVKDNRISWITINIMGTDAEIKISPNLSLNIGNREKITASNLKSNADGTITRMEVKKGTAVVKVGDGVRKGQMLVSGVKEYTDGSSALFDSEAQIYAKTLKTVSVTIPKSYEILQKTNAFIHKSDINIMGLQLPLTLYGNPNGDYIMQSDKQQLTILGNGVPIYFLSETWRQYEKKPVRLTDGQAQTLLQNKLQFYELFMLYSADKASILSRKYTLSQDEEQYILTADYEIEENIAEKSIIQVKESQNEDISKSGT